MELYTSRRESVAAEPTDDGGGGGDESGAGLLVVGAMGAGGTEAPPEVVGAGGAAPNENLKVEEGPMRSRRSTRGKGVGARHGESRGRPRRRLLWLLPLLLLPLWLLLLPPGAITHVPSIKGDECTPTLIMLMRMTSLQLVEAG